ncbi:MAG: hypothetical protein U0350_26585 [Caldilineaceae bacterium]
MDESLIYTIRIQGHLEAKWSDWFEGLQIIHEADGETLLIGELMDYATLNNLLTRAFDMGLPLISVIPDIMQYKPTAC